jgi:hypothetical protein
MSVTLLVVTRTGMLRVECTRHSKNLTGTNAPSAEVEITITASSRATFPRGGGETHWVCPVQIKSGSARSTHHLAPVSKSRHPINPGPHSRLGWHQ